MERNFENSVYFELKNYKGYIFNPMRLCEIFYDENSEIRTKSIAFVLERNIMQQFIAQAKIFSKGLGLSNCFEDISFIRPSFKNDFLKLKDIFVKIINDFKDAYIQYVSYYSYVYASIIISIILAMPGYFDVPTIYEFIHFCRCEHIINV